MPSCIPPLSLVSQGVGAVGMVGMDEKVIGQAAGLPSSRVPGLFICRMSTTDIAHIDGATGLNDTCLPQCNSARQVCFDLIQFGLVCRRFSCSPG